MAKRRSIIPITDFKVGDRVMFYLDDPRTSTRTANGKVTNIDVPGKRVRVARGQGSTHISTWYPTSRIVGFFP